jgi:alanyl-tRNA synthetase
VKPLPAQQIRTEFLEYFQSRAHQKVRSSSLIPSNDPTVLLTTAGMQQFKPYFLGEQTPDERRLTSVQKCFRTSDIEEVGDSTHDTFFEMLGNFSVGDYFKKDAIDFAWDLLVDRWELPRDRLSVTVFGGHGQIPADEEAEQLWVDRGVRPEMIHRFGPEDNFWGPPGVTGPCGPCSEIHYDVTRVPCERGSDCGPNCECGRFLEIWNLVFMQYNKEDENTFNPLPAKNIDTGMGLERIAMVLQEKQNIFNTDLFYPLLEAIGDLHGRSPDSFDTPTLQSARIVADHIRGATFLVSDGVLPSNEGRGYVLRRILRRALVHGRRLGQSGPFVSRLLHVVLDMYQAAYPELTENRNFIDRVLSSEEQRFLETLETGIRIFQTEREKMEAAGQDTIPGPLVFKLYDTYGFPPELTDDMAQERGLKMDRTGFDRCMEEQREKARASWKGNQQEGLGTEGDLAGVESEFIGYDRLEVTSVLARLFVNGQRVDATRKGAEVQFVVSQTPFYAESGGQAGDLGEILGPQGVLQVRETRHGPGEVILHSGTITEGSFQEGEEVLLRVDREQRTSTARNHTATHLLHYALRTLLGDHVRQSGSLVAPDRLRFDFTHYAALTEEEMASLEKLVNRKIRENQPLSVRVVSFQAAQAEKAMALFGEKYGDEVRLVGAGDYSKELCGGTHVTRTGDIGFFKLIHESSVAAGIRRIEAITGEPAVEHIQQVENEFRGVSRTLQARPGELLQRVQQLLQKQKEQEKARKGKAAGQLKDTAVELAGRAETVGDTPLVTARFDGDANTLRTLSDMIRDRLPDSVILLGGQHKDAALLILSVAKERKDRFHAGKLIAEVAKEVGGKGGGRPDMAQAGGPSPEKLEGAFQRLRELIGKG